MIRKIVAGGIIKKDNKFLLVKENKGTDREKNAYKFYDELWDCAEMVLE